MKTTGKMGYSHQETRQIARILHVPTPPARQASIPLCRVSISDAPRTTRSRHCPRPSQNVPLVRRAKAPFFSGCNSHPATVVPSGSNRSGSGGNETAEAFDAKNRIRRFREQAGCNVSERRAGPETSNVGADPAKGWGRPPSQVPGERLDPTCGPTGVMATACLHKESGRNTGSPSGGSVFPTGIPRGTGRAVGGVGEVHSTGEAV